MMIETFLSLLLVASGDMPADPAVAGLPNTFVMDCGTDTDPPSGPYSCPDLSWIPDAACLATQKAVYTFNARQACDGRAASIKDAEQYRSNALALANSLYNACIQNLPEPMCRQQLTGETERVNEVANKSIEDAERVYQHNIAQAADLFWEAVEKICCNCPE